MVTPVLIGVGGTGQNVLISYLRLAELAGFTPALFYILDSDAKGPLTKAAAELKGRVKQVLGGNAAQRWQIDPFPMARAESKTFGTLFGNLTGERRELFNCLFSDEAEQTKIQTGMYGRPSIGATSIRYKILTDDDEFKEMKNTLRGSEKHIILVGSCFGGTGSGGVPMLAQEFHRLKNEPGSGFQGIKVDAVVFLPWFRLVLPEGGLKAGEKSVHEHLNKNFEPNAAAGIHYFKDKIRNYVNTLLLLGVGNPGQISRVSSEDKQDETVHILNLLAAILIQNHFIGALKPPEGIAGYWYDADEGINPRTEMLYRDEKSFMPLVNVIKRTSFRAEWLAVLKTFFSKYSEIDQLHRPPFLDGAIEKLKGMTRSEAQVLEDIAKYFEDAEKQVTEGFNWLDKMSDPQFFQLKVEDKKVSVEYDDGRKDPLPKIQKWCNQDGLLDKFEAADFKTVEVFCEKFVAMFMQKLINDFNL